MKRLTASALFLALLLIVQLVFVSAAETDFVSYIVTEGGNSAISALGLNANASIVDTDTVDFDGEALLLYDITYDTMLYAKNIDEQREPASLTKVMTCLLALEYGNLEDLVPVTASATASLDDDSSTAGLLPGETYTLEELLYCLMVNSSNDAALVIAEYIGGSQDAFVEMMNEKAEELGCTETHFTNAHGLHDDAHYSTARDMAKIFMAAMQYEMFESLYSTGAYEVSATEQQSYRTIYSTNYLISTAITSSYYDDRVIGGKTGFTTPAGRCVICTAEVDERMCLVVVLGASSINDDGEAVYGNFKTVSAMLDYTFNNIPVTEILPEHYVVVSVPVLYGSSDVTLDTPETVSAPLPISYDPALISIQYYLYSEDISAPIAQDDELGSIVVCYNGAEISTSTLVAAATVKTMSEEIQMALGSNIIPENPSEDDIEVSEDSNNEESNSSGETHLFHLVLMVMLAAVGICVIIFAILVLRAAIIRRQRRKRRKKRR